MKCPLKVLTEKKQPAAAHSGVDYFISTRFADCDKENCMSFEKGECLNEIVRGKNENTI